MMVFEQNKNASSNASTVNCIVFLRDDTLLSGDESGNLAIWSPLQNERGNLEIIVKEFQAHEVSEH